MLNLKRIFSATFFLLLIFASSVFAQDAVNNYEFYEKGDYQKSAEVLRKAVDNDKNDRRAWLYLGMSYARLKRTEEALKAFDEADNLTGMKLLENEEPPKTLSKPRAAYTDEARANGVTGTVKLAVEWGADGEIKFIFPYKTLPDGLTEQVIEAAKKVRFEPAKRDGKPINFITTLEYAFSIY
jgi:TonB family protein